jgi:poly-beta-1,6-N-acetyl-D-glucosamine synthase
MMSQVFLGLLVAFTGFYIVMMSIALYGIIKREKSNPGRIADKRETVTIVIPFRNEKNRIAPLIDALKQQMDTEFSVVFCDDHSDDCSSEFIRNRIPSHWLIISSEGQGKKAAVRTAVKHVESDWIVFTDADSTPDCRWIEGIRCAFSDADFVFGPVITKGKGFFSGLQYCDQLSLSATSVAMAKVGLPFICSAANMAIRKRIFPQKVIRGDDLKSGDDVFLLHWALEQGYRVKGLWNSQTTVEVLVESRLIDFLRQRLRWAGKSTGYRQITAGLVALVVAGANGLVLIGGLLGLIHPSLFATLLICLLLKGLIDFLFLLLSERGLKQNRVIWYFFPAFFFHLVYVSIVALAAPCWRLSWKGREV